jgi:trimethylamine monooxygenase
MQGKYVECLMLATGYGSEVKASDFIEGINQVFLDWEHLKVKDIMGYRNYAHKSLVTGNEAPKPHASKNWVDNTSDDSIEFFKTMHLE